MALALPVGALTSAEHALTFAQPRPQSLESLTSRSRSCPDAGTASRDRRGILQPADLGSAVLARPAARARDGDDIAAVWQRLADLLAEQPGREHEADAAMQESERWTDPCTAQPGSS